MDASKPVSYTGFESLMVDFLKSARHDNVLYSKLKMLKEANDSLHIMNTMPYTLSDTIGHDKKNEIRNNIIKQRDEAEHAVKIAFHTWMSNQILIEVNQWMNKTKYVDAVGRYDF